MATASTFSAPVAGRAAAGARRHSTPAPASASAAAPRVGGSRAVRLGLCIHSAPLSSPIRQSASRPLCRRAVDAARPSVTAQAMPEALLFDCDGVLVDTEKDGHRVSFNKAFKEKGLDLEWDVPTYGRLLEIGGGKERMTHHFNETSWPAGWPEDADERQARVKELHLRKTDIFMDLIATGALPLRPGVQRLVDEARAAGVQLAVCSTSNEKAVQNIVDVMLGPERAKVFPVFAGDMVRKKKPAPDVYLMAADKLGVDPAMCWVVEDTHIGLCAAKAAGMRCVVTTSPYTEGEDFTAADAVFPEIGDASDPKFSLSDLAAMMTANA